MVVARQRPTLRGAACLCFARLRRNLTRRSASNVRCQLTIFSPQDIQADKPLGTLGYTSMSSYSAEADKQGLVTVAGMSDLLSVAGSQVTEGQFQVRLYRGQVVQGRLVGTPVILKAYPSRFLREADMLAANELISHATLQPPAVEVECPHLAYLLGGFQTEGTGEQWLVFRDDGSATAGTYAKLAAKATGMNTCVGAGDLYDLFDSGRALRRRKKFVLRIMRQVLQAVAAMHGHGRVHCSLGPASVLLPSMDESKVDQLQVRVRDLAFSVDVRDAALYGGATLAELWEGRDYRGRPDFNCQAAGPKQGADDARDTIADRLWARAAAAGARRKTEQRNFAISGDIYSAGLLLAFMAFTPFSVPDSIDSAVLQRLIEVTFQYDIPAMREYCLADDRWGLAVDFLDTGNRAGWELLQAMVNPDWRLRPTAASCLKHPFLTGVAFGIEPAADG